MSVHYSCPKGRTDTGFPKRRTDTGFPKRRTDIGFLRLETGFPRLVILDAQVRGKLKALPALDSSKLWSAQKRAIENLERSLAKNNPRSLIQRATGSGKTFTAVNACYRLIKFGGARRVLFLVDHCNLGRQTYREFQQFVSPVNAYWKSSSLCTSFRGLGDGQVAPIARLHPASATLPTANIARIGHLRQSRWYVETTVARCDEQLLLGVPIVGATRRLLNFLSPASGAGKPGWCIGWKAGSSHKIVVLRSPPRNHFSLQSGFQDYKSLSS